MQATPATPEQIRHHQIKRRMAIQEQDKCEALPVPATDLETALDVPLSARQHQWNLDVANRRRYLKFTRLLQQYVSQKDAA